MKRLAILVVGICSLSLFADKEVTIKDINGNDFTTAFQQISSAYFYLHKPQGFNQRVANGDGSITIINPAFDYAGKKIPFADGHNGNTGVCHYFGFSQSHGNEGQFKQPDYVSAIMNKDGTLDRIRHVTTTLGGSYIIKTVVCSHRSQ